MILIPAYGRDYSNAQDAIEGFHQGYDWQIASVGRYHGQYTSIRDVGVLRAEGYTALTLRYGRLKLSTIVNLDDETIKLAAQRPTPPRRK